MDVVLNCGLGAIIDRPIVLFGWVEDRPKDHSQTPGKDKFSGKMFNVISILNPNLEVGIS